MQVVTAIAGQAGAIDAINKIGKGLKSSYVTSLASDATKNQIIDTLNYFNADAWHKLAKAIPSASDVINTSSTHIIGMNDFFAGINVSQTPGFHPSIYWLIPILAALFQYLSAKTMKQPELDGNNPAAGMTKSMTVMMPLMSLYFCLVTPAGLGLYWIATAVVQTIITVFINRYYDKLGADEIVKRNVEKRNKKRAKKGLPPEKIAKNATTSTKNMSASREKAVKSLEQIKAENEKKVQEIKESSKYYKTAKPGSLAEKAGMVAKYNEKNTKNGGKKN